MDGFKLVTATTVVAGGGCKDSRLNFCGFPMHSFHRLIAISLPLMVLKLCLVLDLYKRTDCYILLRAMYTFHRLIWVGRMIPNLLWCSLWFSIGRRCSLNKSKYNCVRGRYCIRWETVISTWVIRRHFSEFYQIWLGDETKPSLGYGQCVWNVFNFRHEADVNVEVIFEEFLYLSSLGQLLSDMV